MHTHFALDFDGTISPVDTTDLLLAAFADPGCEDIEAEWRAGRIGSRECLSRQVALIRARPQDLHAVLAGVTLDPDFIRFATAAWLRRATLSVVSDGFDLAIVHLLHAHGIDLPVVSNRMIQVGADGWRAEFSTQGERCGSGTCKCAAVPADRRVILIGDGRSDFCLARKADFVLAKGELAAFCAAQGIPHRKIAGFADALSFITSRDRPVMPALSSFTRPQFEDLHA